MTATAYRAPSGRFAARPPIAVCSECGCTLAEDLVGRLYCALKRCDHYRIAVDVVPGVDVGTLTAEMLGVQ